MRYIYTQPSLSSQALQRTGELARSASFFRVSERESERLRDMYKECMRNHAAKLGTYAADGCCEFIPDEDSPLNTLHCAACGCHRNFHRKEISWPRGSNTDAATMLASNAYSPEARRRPRTKFSEEQKARLSSFAEQIGWRIPKRDSGAGSGREEDEVARFCREIGVSRQVFKVWLHNHKGGPVSVQLASSIAESNGGAVPSTPTFMPSDDFMEN